MVAVDEPNAAVAGVGNMATQWLEERAATRALVEEMASESGGDVDERRSRLRPGAVRRRRGRRGTGGYRDGLDGQRGWYAVDNDESDVARRDDLQVSRCRPHGNDTLPHVLRVLHDEGAVRVRSGVHAGIHAGIHLFIPAPNNLFGSFVHSFIHSLINLFGQLINRS